MTDIPSALAIGTLAPATRSLRALIASSVLATLVVWTRNGPLVKVVSRVVSGNYLVLRPYFAYHFHKIGLQTVEFGHRKGSSATCNMSKRPCV